MFYLIGITMAVKLGHNENPFMPIFCADALCFSVAI